MKAFLVDDEVLVRGYLAELLSEQGVCVVGEAGDAPSALSGIRAIRPDVVFVDVRMPGVSGLHLAEEIGRMEDPPLVVLATGHSEHAVAGFDLGAADYLLKPVSPERLMRCLAKLGDAMRPRAVASPASIDRIALRSDAGIRLADPAEVACATTRDRKVYVRLDNGEEYRWAGSL
ncbi:MAG: LytR/AlgR family response regulator transcription factor, partial [Armatimonadota bacterium]